MVKKKLCNFLLVVLALTSNWNLLNGAELVDFDANKSKYDLKNKIQEISGEVFLAYQQTLICADSIKIDHNKKILFARGHVVAVRGDALFVAEELSYDSKKDLFKLIKGSFYASAKELIDAHIDKILGIDSSAKELQVEKDKENRENKIVLKNRYQSLYFKNNQERDNIIATYALLLKQEKAKRHMDKTEVTSQQQNRRRIWQKLQSSNAANTKTLLNNTYFKLSGQKIIYDKDKVLNTNNAVFTNCKCKADESADWSISASHITAEQEGYVDTRNIVFSIKDIPIVYLPRITVPIKTKPQSGLLMPSFSFAKEQFSYSQPMYYNFANNSDFTLTPTYYKSRGVHLAFERRYIADNFNFKVLVGAIRDELWLGEKISTEARAGTYKKSLDSYLISKSIKTKDSEYNNFSFADWQNLSEKYCQFSRDQRSCLEAVLAQNFYQYKSTWRAGGRWEFAADLGKSLVFNSKADLAGDNSYDNHFSLDSTNKIMNLSDGGDYLKRSNFLLNKIDRGYYFALSSNFFDNLTDYNMYDGLQNPLSVDYYSRYYPLISLTKKLSLRFAGRYRLVYLKDFYNSYYYTDKKSRDVEIKSAYMQHLDLDFILPSQVFNLFKVDYKVLIKNSYVSSRLNNSAAQYIEDTSNYGEMYSGGLSSFSFASDITLPLYREYFFLDKQSQTIVHEMDYKVGYFIQPFCYQSGDYPNKRSSNYYDSKAKAWSPDVKSKYLYISYRHQEQMKFFRKIKFESSNRLYFNKYHINLPKETYEDAHRQAKYELNYDIENEIKKLQKDVKFEKTLEERDLFLSVVSLIDYNLDYFSDSKNIDLHPWSNIKTNFVVNLEDLTLKLLNEYDQYNNKVVVSDVKVSINFTDMFCQYTNYYDHKNKHNIHAIDLSYSMDVKRKISTRLGLRNSYIDQKKDYEARLSLDYVARSTCWGYKFMWNKGFSEKDWYGSFYLSFSFYFMGKEKSYNNFLSKLNTSS
jgi:hypothetical protein